MMYPSVLPCFLRLNARFSNKNARQCTEQVLKNIGIALNWCELHRGFSEKPTTFRYTIRRYRYWEREHAKKRNRTIHPICRLSPTGR